VFLDGDFDLFFEYLLLSFLSFSVAPLSVSILLSAALCGVRPLSRLGKGELTACACGHFSALLGPFRLEFVLRVQEEHVPHGIEESGQNDVDRSDRLDSVGDPWQFFWMGEQASP
jgi:hypothetical protein